jgi:hypothetical protein
MTVRELIVELLDQNLNSDVRVATKYGDMGIQAAVRKDRHGSDVLLDPLDFLWEPTDLDGVRHEGYEEGFRDAKEEAGQ